MNLKSSGKYLVQYKLSRLGIQSSKVDIDSSVDIIAFSSESNRWLRIKVETAEKPDGVSDQDRQSLKWKVSNGADVDVIALADVSKDKLWLFKKSEFKRHARQYKTHDTLQFNLYDDHLLANRYADFLVENKGEVLFA